MFKFDPSKMELRRVKFRNVSQALGGSVSILDEKHFVETGKEQFKRISAPLHACRKFIIKNKGGRFFRPTEGAIMFYGDEPVALELSSLKDRLQQSFEGKEREWISQMDRNWESIQEEEHLADGHQWYFDGTFIYKFEHSIAQMVEEGEFLSADGKFRSVPCEAIKLSDLSGDSPRIENRCCVAFVAQEGHEWSLSAPVWKNLGRMPSRAEDSDRRDDDNAGISENFDKVDELMAVNLNFVLAAARAISDQFGYESVEPLQLPRMMIELKTVNLPKVVKEIKASHDTGLVFSHVMAWLLGLQKKATEFSQYAELRRMMKYLTTKGIFRKDQMSLKRVYHNINDAEAGTLPPLLTREEALTNGLQLNDK